MVKVESISERTRDVIADIGFESMRLCASWPVQTYGALIKIHLRCLLYWRAFGRPAGRLEIPSRPIRTAQCGPLLQRTASPIWWPGVPNPFTRPRTHRRQPWFDHSEERCDSRGTWQTVPTFLQHRRCVGSWSWFDFDGKESATVIDSRGGCRLPRNGLPDGHLVNFWTHAVPGLDIGVIAA